MFHLALYFRLAPSFSIPYATKSDIHGIIMNPIVEKKSLSVLMYYLRLKDLSEVYIITNLLALRFADLRHGKYMCSKLSVCLCGFKK